MNINSDKKGEIYKCENSKKNGKEKNEKNKKIKKIYIIGFIHFFVFFPTSFLTKAETEINHRAEVEGNNKFVWQIEMNNFLIVRIPIN